MPDEPQEDEPLFDHNLVYPSDGVGPYVELWGDVTSVGIALGDAVRLTVDTPRGPFNGWMELHGSLPEHVQELLGGRAKIRLYSGGGGFYPDNRVMSWTRKE